MSDMKAGTALIATGAGGSFVQALVEWTSMAVTIGNGLLLIGGLYLMWYKIKDTKRRDRREEDKDG